MMYMVKRILLFLSVIITEILCANEDQANTCVSRSKFDQLKRNFHYWQNTTLSIIKHYVVDEKDVLECPCVEQIDSLKNIVDQNLNPTLSSLNSTHDQKLDTVLQLINSSMTMVKSEVAALDKKIESAHSSFNSTCDINPTSLPLGSFLNPVASCKNIPTSSPSGNYWIQSTSTGYATMEYCDMSPSFNQSRASGCMRVAQLDTTDPQEHCPSGFRTITSPKRMCRRSSGPGCASTTFSVNGVHYSKVCGKVIGYQYYSMDAFAPYYGDRSRTIDDVYVDGVSVTHGQSPRQHTWTFANALDETHSQNYVCPCTKTTSTFTGVVPPFIGSDYFCDTGSRYSFTNQWYTADPLWDGEGCGGSSTCCGFNNPPWFCKDLPQSTTDDIELRLCSDQDISNEDIGLEIVEIYVQ